MIPKNELATPILLIIFNRRETTKKVFEVIRAARPKKLFIAADGFRENKSDENLICEETRLLTENIDWPCEVSRKYSQTNMGCDPHVESAVSWFFEHVDQGIILEDDCVPNQSFFGFCEQMLDKYKDNTEVMHINGSNFQFGKENNNASYYFSVYPHSWGWATWKRAWKKYDSKMCNFPEFKETKSIKKILPTTAQQKFHLNLFEKLYEGKYTFWDSKWTFAIWFQNGICITPKVNLISNIGHGTNATHTIAKEKIHQESTGLTTIVDPISTSVNQLADKRTFLVYYYRSLLQKIQHRLIKLFS